MKDQPFTAIEPLHAPGEPREYVGVADGFVVPRRFRAESESLAVEIEMSAGGEPRCVGIVVRDPAGLTSQSLRRVAVGRLIRQATAGAARKMSDDGVFQLLSTPPDESATFYRKYTDDVRVARRGSPLTADNLAAVAKVYRAAIEQGDPPTQTVADVMHVARSTAARWVRRARDAGYLGEATPGRGGEG